MTRRTARKIQAFKVRTHQPEVEGRAPTYRASTVIPARELVEWVGDDGDILMARVQWKRELYLIWKDDWQACEEE
jgi:hypothetical protein